MKITASRMKGLGSVTTTTPTTAETTATQQGTQAGVCALVFGALLLAGWVYVAVYLPIDTNKRVRRLEKKLLKKKKEDDE